MRDFTIYNPVSTGEALDLLRSYGQDAMPLAGGTDLLVRLKRGLLRPQVLVNLKGVDELAGIKSAGDRLVLGPLVRLAELEKSPVAERYCPVLAQTARQMASVQIRNLATVGGNICNASPAADLGPPLVALDASLEMRGPQGAREIKVAGFFTGPGNSACAPGELVTGLHVPLPGPGERTVYLKFSLRRAHDIALVGVAVWLRLREGTIEACRIALGAVGPTVLRAPQAEESLLRRRADAAELEEAGRLAAAATRPIDDLRASAAYRREIVRVLVVRALSQALTMNPPTRGKGN